MKLSIAKKLARQIGKLDARQERLLERKADLEDRIEETERLIESERFLLEQYLRGEATTKWDEGQP